MKKHPKKLLGALIVLAALWALAFAVQESMNASLRDKNRIDSKPILQGLTRLRPVKEKHLAYVPELPGGYLEYYADEKGHELPKGWQLPGTEQLEMVWRGFGRVETATFIFDEPPWSENYIRLAKITFPSLRRVTCKAYLLGIFPQRGFREGCLLYSNNDFGATIKAYHEGDTASGHYPVMRVDGPEAMRVHLNYISTRDAEALAEAILTGEGFDRVIYPLFADTPGSEILRYPTKIYFP